MQQPPRFPLYFKIEEGKVHDFVLANVRRYMRTVDLFTIHTLFPHTLSNVIWDVELLITILCSYIRE